ncbi:MAG: 5-methyltetrahydropteroyltriglutamate--homocysteine methyltransferase [Chloroflexi bacterium]|nr:5-methyltetrahydropteroyltriglutamate--homocysteine methyltransferase [Chloroflexota bacterium]
MPNEVLLTTVVGSYPQPEWLIDRKALGNRLPPRVRAQELWRIPAEFLDEAQNDATVVAIRDMAAAGMDIISDGEQRRESYSNYFANSLEGVDLNNPGTALDRTGRPNPVPRVAGPIRRVRPQAVEDVKFLRSHTDRSIKITLPGPFTMTQQAQNDHYADDEAMAMDYAVAVNQEIKDLFAAGADVVQLDEPYMQARPEKAKLFAVKAINKALEGVQGTTAVHMCFGYAAAVGHDKPNGYSFLSELTGTTVQQISIEAAQPKLDLAVLKELPNQTIILGVLDLNDPKAETADQVAERIRVALKYVAPERLMPAPDCGMKYLPRELAFRKLQALVEGAAIVRSELVR